VVDCREQVEEGMWDVVVLSLIVYWKRSCLLFFFLLASTRASLSFGVC
jgi:hypothetical protein